jgi:hypothetical protein
MQHRFLKTGKGRSLARFSTALFDSVQDGLRFYETICKDESLIQRDRIVEFNNRHEQRWTGCDSAEQFEGRIRQGWVEGADRLMKLPIKEVSPVSIKRRRYQGDQGDDLDIHKVNRGELDTAWTYRKRDVKRGVGRQVTVVCNLAANCGTNADSLFWRGASALRLAETLESAGYSVRIVAALCATGIDTNGNVDNAYLFEIKSLEQPIDVSNLASIVCLPAYFRIIGFGTKVWACNTNGMTASCGLGRSNDDGIARAMDEWYPNEYYLTQPGSVLSERDAADWIAATVDAVQNPQQLAA